MNRRAAAVLVILIVGIAAGAYIYVELVRPGQPIDLKDELSESFQNILINEVRPGDGDAPEYVELYTDGGFEDVSGWILTTYDGDRFVLPSLTGSADFAFIVVSSGDGSDDLDLDDGQVTIHTGLAIQNLDVPGDEVGLHDSEGALVSFMRYGGGNGDPVLGNWPEAEDGVDVPTEEEYAISLMGNSESYSSSWLSTANSPGEPNAELFTTTGDYGGEQVLITNGLRVVEDFDGVVRPDLGRGENVTITAGPGVNATVVDMVKEHINFSLNFYREHNFTDPATAAGNEIRIRLVRSGSSESTGLSRSNGEIIIEVGARATKEELKVVGEHELMHLFQFRIKTDSMGGSYRPIHEPDYWWDEGMAEFWAVYSMLRNYPNMTMSQWNAMARAIGSLNWFDHFRDTNGTTPFHGWDGTWDSYMASFLFIKFVNETYGAATLLRVFNATKHYGPGDARNTDPKDAFADALNMTWSEIYGLFLSWLFLDSHHANGVPVYTPHVRLNYTGGAIGDTIGVRGGGGAVIEEVEVSNNTSFRLHLNYSGPAQNWTVVVLVFYEDGTNETIQVPLNSTTQEGEIFVDPHAEKTISRVWVVKSVTEGAASGRISMRIIPSIDLSYDNETASDTVTVQPGESVYEVVDVNNPQAFSVFLNWTESPSHWKITILRFWDDGTNDTFETEIVNGTWPGYTVNPVAGPTTITRLVFIKENVLDTPANITMMVTPTTEIPSNADSPMEPDRTYHWHIDPWDPYGGLLDGYLFIEFGTAYDLVAEEVVGDFFGMVLASNLTVVHEFLITPSSPLFQLQGYDTGLYYFVLVAGPPEGFVGVEAKPYDWP
ncbi:hypothetical protein EU520_00430 [Candidatus Thorarchaeota archaeon]|nr:MAG: hypothetical protein EU520_00430 [Candidatus Thorarchaeota archaeon]